METIIQRILKLLLSAYGAQYDLVTVTEQNGHYTANIETEVPAVLIGKGGCVLNAIQTLLKNILWRQTGENVFVSVDTDGYRAQQHEKLYTQVKETIDSMKTQNLGELTLPPMKPFYRRLAHLFIAEHYPELTSEGVGEEPRRRVRVFYK